MSTTRMVPDVDADPCVARLVAEHAAGRMTVPQLVRLTLAVGRLQGHYISAAHLAADAGVVRDFNSTRPRPAVESAPPAPRSGGRMFRRLAVVLFSRR